MRVISPPHRVLSSSPDFSLYTLITCKFCRRVYNPPFSNSIPSWRSPAPLSHIYRIYFLCSRILNIGLRSFVFLISKSSISLARPTYPGVCLCCSCMEIWRQAETKLKFPSLAKTKFSTPVQSFITHTPPRASVSPLPPFKYATCISVYSLHGGRLRNGWVEGWFDVRKSFVDEIYLIKIGTVGKRHGGPLAAEKYCAKNVSCYLKGERGLTL